jgi:hypothetical protein
MITPGESAIILSNILSLIHPSTSLCRGATIIKVLMAADIFVAKSGIFYSFYNFKNLLNYFMVIPITVYVQHVRPKWGVSGYGLISKKWRLS